MAWLAQAEQAGMEVLRGAGAVVPADRELVGDQRQARGNAAEALRAPRGRLGGGALDPPSAADAGIMSRERTCEAHGGSRPLTARGAPAPIPTAAPCWRQTRAARA